MESREKMREKLKRAHAKKYGTDTSTIEDKSRLANQLDNEAGNLYNSGKFEEAVEIYKKLLKTCEEIQTANKTKIGVLEVTVDDTILNTHYMLGRCYFQLQNFRDAITHFEALQAKKKTYQYYEIMYYLGTSYEDIKEYKKAELYLRNAINNPNKNSEFCCLAYLNLASGLCNKNFQLREEENNQTLIDYCLNAHQYKPNEANFNIGKIYLLEGEIGKAIRYLRKASDSGYLDAHIELANVYFFEKYGIRDSKQAFFYFEKAAKLGDAISQFNAAYLYDEGEGIEKSTEKALYWYEEARKRKFPAASYNLGFKYLEDNDVTTDNAKAVKLFKESAALDHPQAFNELGRCYFKGWGIEKDLTKAKENFEEAFKKEILEAGNNLATIYFEEGITQSEISKKASLIGKAITIWENLTQKDHALAFMNLGIVYDNMPSSGIVLNFEKAEQYYSRAIDFEIPEAATNLAVLYLTYFVETKEKQLSNQFLQKFKKTIERGRQLGNVSSDTMAAQLENTEIDYSILLKIAKQFKHFKLLTCIDKNKDIITYAHDSDLKLGDRIKKILAISLTLQADPVNLSTATHLIGKLYQESDLNQNFLFSNYNKIVDLMKLIEKKIQYFNQWSLANIITGLASFAVDPNERQLASILDILSKKINSDIKNYTLNQRLTILHAIAVLGTGHATLTILGKSLVESIVKESLKIEEVAELLYNLALLENHWQHQNANMGFLFNKEIYLGFVKQIPPVNALIDIPVLNKLHLSLLYFIKVLKHPAFSEKELLNYFNSEIVEKLKDGSTVTKMPQSKSGLQKQVAFQLRIFFPTLKEEFFIGSLPADIFIKDVCMLKVDGPRHFLMNVQTNEKVRTPKDLLISAILRVSIKEKEISIPYDEWQLAVEKNKIIDYLKGKFGAIGYELSKPSRHTAQQLTFTYDRPSSNARNVKQKESISSTVKFK